MINTFVGIQKKRSIDADDQNQTVAKKQKTANEGKC